MSLAKQNLKKRPSRATPVSQILENTGDKVKAIFTILNDKGLHTRPTTELVRCAARFNARTQLRYGGLKANAKSLLEILMLAAGKGAKISVEAEGPEAFQVVEAILELANNRFYIHY